MGKTYSMSYQDRMEILDSVKQYLLDERKFYVNRKDWPRVKLLNEKLKKHESHSADARFHRSRDSYQSA
jgi:predicted nucleic-acid-binding protein